MEHNRTITFYVDRVPKYQGDEFAYYCYCYEDTVKAIRARIPEIHTTSLACLSFELIDLYGYEIFVIRNGVKLHCYPGMDCYSGKDIRKEHNLMRLMLGGAFDKDFGL